MDPQLIQALMAQAQQPQTNTICEFRAGILTQKDTTVTADERKGKLALIQAEDGRLHLKWTLRPSGTVVTDITIYPKSATWERVPECEDGRVYLLQFKSSPSNRRFFWMQEPSEDKDEEWAKKINDTIESPPPAQENTLASMMGGDFDQARLRSLLGGPQAASRPAAARPTAGAGNQDASAAGAGNQDASAAMAESLQAMQESLAAQTSTSLQDILHGPRTIAALDDDMIARLTEHLPDDEQTPHGVRESIRSPQFQQTLQRLSSILNSPQFPALMASLSLPHTGAIGVEAFIAALEEEARKEQQQ